MININGLDQYVDEHKGGKFNMFMPYYPFYWQNDVLENNLPGVDMENVLAVPEYHLGFWIGGLISHQFFRKYTLTFDFTGMSVCTALKNMGL